MKIVENVLDNVPAHTQCAFILPDKKLEKASKAQMKRILKNHRLRKVIKLPEDLFFGVGITTSIFVFEAGVGQDTREFNPLVCMFLASCLQTVVHKYPYNFGLFPDLLKEEKIKLPVIADGTPDWIYMGEYMRMRMESAKTDLVNMQSAL